MSEGMRWWLRQPNSRPNTWFASVHPERGIGYDGAISVMPVTEHERIVAELKAQLEHSETKVGWLLHDNEKNVRERDAAIATQAKVIEVLKPCILKEDKRCGIWHDGRKAIEQAETIDRGEALMREALK